MEKVNVRIDKAQISSFRVDLRGDRVELDVRIDLYANDKIVTDFYMYGDTQDRASNTYFMINPVLIDPIKRIAKELERVVVEKYNSQFLIGS